MPRNLENDEAAPRFRGLEIDDGTPGRVPVPGPDAPTREQFAAYTKMYDYFNGALFGERLPSVVLNFSRHSNSYGFFAPERWRRREGEAVTHEISINPAHLAARSPKETASTLVHEMAHLWQYTYGSPARGGYHNREWSEKMQQLGLQPIDLKTRAERMSAENLGHAVIGGGAFDRAFNVMPKAYLLPWSCDEAPAATEGGEGEGEGTSASPGGVEGRGAAAPVAPVAKSRNKVKYTCPGCLVNVWGRPDLVVICGRCREPFAWAAQ